MGQNLPIHNNMIAGAAASVFQTTMLHPFEFLKTGQQLHRSLPNAGSFSMFYQVKTYFAGCLAVNTGMVLKTMVRFTTFEKACELLKDRENPNMPITGMRLIGAGSITGFMESMVIIPFENIKTRMIENNIRVSEQSADLKASGNVTKNDSGTKFRPKFHNGKQELNPRYERFLYYEKRPSTSVFTVIKEMYQTRGVHAFVQGTFPTIFRQIGNSTVRFTTYTTLKQLVSPTKPLNEYYAFALGFISSCAVVGFTQPFDVIKTRMQSKYSWKFYKNSLNCAYRCFVEEGLHSLWKGWLPRLFKVGLSGGVSFGVYQYVDNMMLQIQYERSLGHNSGKP